MTRTYRRRRFAERKNADGYEYTFAAERSSAWTVILLSSTALAILIFFHVWLGWSW